MKKRKLIVFLSLLLLLLTGMCTGAAAQTCYEVNQQHVPSCFQYMTDFYINRYPYLGTEFTYGSASDRAVLSKLADLITAGKTTPKEMADAVAQWTKRNIEYMSFSSDEGYMFAQDVFFHRKGNCVGYAMLMEQLLRLKGVPAVMQTGIRGNMQTSVTTDNLSFFEEEYGHAWICIYDGSEWLLYDPLFDTYGLNNAEAIKTWYFIEDIEGITPTYPGMDLKLIQQGINNYYINGKVMRYAYGVPASQYYQMSVSGATKSINNCIAYRVITRYAGTNSKGEFMGRDGYQYLTSPERKDAMADDECYTDDWIIYGSGDPDHLAKPNGILYSNTILQRGDQTIFLSYDGNSIELQGNPEDYSLVEGYPAVKKGSSIKIYPKWCDQDKASGEVIVWENDTPDIVSVTDDGVITGLKSGLAVLIVASRDTVDSGNHHASIIQVYVVDEYRTWDYEDRPIKENDPSDETEQTKHSVGAVVSDKKTNASYKVTSAAGTTGKTPAVAYRKPKNAKAKVVTIPSTVKLNSKSYKITSIADNAFKNNKNITKLTVGANISRIGKNAFYGCKKLKSVTIKSKKLTSKNIGSSAFKKLPTNAVIRVPKSKVKAYKKLFRSKGLNRKIKVRGF